MKNHFAKRIFSITMALVMVFGMLPMTSFTVAAVEGYTYIDADGSQKSLSEATTVSADTTTWNNGWYYVGGDVAINSGVTVSGDVKLILGAGSTLNVGQGIHVSGGNTLTIYSQETAGTLTVTGTKYHAAIGGKGIAGAFAEEIDTSVGTIVINGGNITATGGQYGAAIGGGFSGKNGNITINGGNVTAVGGEFGAGIGSSQLATGTMYITINGGTVNANGGNGAAAIGTGYGAEKDNAAIINITGGDITAGRNWAAASIGNGVQSNGATMISTTGGVIDAELIGDYKGGWSATLKDLRGAGFKQNPAAFLLSNQYTELKNGLYYIHWEKASAVISTSVQGDLAVWVDNVATSHSGTRYENGILYIYGLSAGNVKATLNGTDYYGVLADASSETELKTGYVKATSISLNVDSITAGAPIDLAKYVVFQPQDVTFAHKITVEIITGSTTSSCTLNGSVLTASAGKVTVKITASDGYASCSGTFSFDVAESDDLDIAYGDIEISQNSDGNYDVSYAGFTGGKKTYGATEAIVITGTTEEYTVKVLSGTPTVVLDNCNITTWVAHGTTVSPFAISSGATVYLMLQGESTLKVASTKNEGDVAAIAVPGGASLYINGTGILNAFGKSNGGAIGGNYKTSLGDVIIDGGTINAGYTSRSEYDIYYGTAISGANITINGGTVNANAGMYGTAIGSTYLGQNATTVTINGGVVNASAVFDNYSEGVAIGNARDSRANCSVIINGGTVAASSECEGAAIGSAVPFSADVSTSVTINGGTVTATSTFGAGIGTARDGKNSGSTVTIHGGTVTATGYYGAGIGGGDRGKGATVTIHGGTVTAIGNYGAGIGDGEEGSGTAVTIHGGTVTATGKFGAGIGGGYEGSGGTVTITGGNIHATATDSNAIGAGKEASGEWVLCDAQGNAVSLNAITLTGAAANTAVSAIEGVTYGLKDVKTLDTNKLYFYLPTGTAATAITAGGNKYLCISSDLIGYTSHDWSNSDGICVNCGMQCTHAGAGDLCTICGKLMHTHSWSYSASGDTITAICNAEGCPDAEQSITISAEGKTYDGTPVTATLDGAIDGVVAPEISYSGNTNAGTYTASITVEGKTASVEFTIEKATVTVTADAKSKTYGTDNPELTYTVSGLFGSDTLTGALATTATKTSNAGEYDITVGSLAGSNYTINFVGAKLTITKAAAPEIVWPTAAELTYGQKLSDSTLTSEDENGTFAWQDGSIVPTVTNNGYVVVYTPKDTDNYDYSSVAMEQTVSVTVSKVSATETAAPTPNDLTYTGEAQNLISGGEAEGGEMQYSTDNQNWSTTIPQGTDAGKYTVYYKVVGDANHSDTAVDSVEITIAKATPFCAAPVGLTALYGQTLADVLLPENAPGETAGKWVWEDATTAAMKVGKNNFPAIFVPTDSANYEDVQMELEVEVICDHEFNVNEATCVSPKQCSICGEIIAEIDPNNHSYEPLVIAPTCTEIGYTVYSCVCGKTYSADVVSALGHSYDDGVVTLEPTCTVEGVRLFTCTVCGATKEEAEPVIAHTPGEKQEIVVSEPVCGEEGLKQLLVHCTVCGLGLVNEVEKIPALEHRLDINGDDRVNNSDVVTLLWYTLYPELNKENLCTDLDHNGECNNDDLLVLLWHVLFPEEDLL